MGCGRSLHAVYEALRANQARYAAESPLDSSCALLSSRLMEQAEVLLRSPVIRDHFYAENVLGFLAPQGEASKLIVSAHNAHISNSLGAMGRALKRQLGPRYLTVGITFGSGDFRARLARPGAATAGPPVSVQAPAPRADSYEQTFHRVGLPSFLVDLRHLAPVSTSWLRGPHPLWSIGGVYGRGEPTSPARLPEEYDLFLFFDHARSSIPLAGS